MIISYQDDFVYPELPAGERFVVLGSIGGLTYATTSLVGYESALLDDAARAALRDVVRTADAVGARRMLALYDLELATLDEVRDAVWQERKGAVQAEILRRADLKDQVNALRKTVGLLYKGLKPIFAENLSTDEIAYLDGLAKMAADLDAMIEVYAGDIRGKIFAAGVEELRQGLK